MLFRHSDLEEGINHDIIFEGVEYFAAPLCFDLLGFKLKSDEEELEVKMPFLPSKIVYIEHVMGRGIVVLRRVLYQVNQLMPTETSIPIKREKPLTVDDINKIRQEVLNEGYSNWHNNNCSNWEVVIPY